MKIRKFKNGRIRFSAENERDSLSLLKTLEHMAGKGDDPNRLCIKKEQELLAKESNQNIKNS